MLFALGVVQHLANETSLERFRGTTFWSIFFQNFTLRAGKLELTAGF